MKIHHYAALAEHIRETMESWAERRLRALWLAAALKQMNPTFDTERFAAYACGDSKQF